MRLILALLALAAAPHVEQYNVVTTPSTVPEVFVGQDNVVLGAAPLALFDPGYRKPSVANLPDAITLNGITVSPTCKCTVTASGMSCTGVTLAEASTGASPTYAQNTPLIGDPYAVTFSGTGKVLQATDASACQIGTEDFYVSATLNGAAYASGEYIAGAITAATGWMLREVASTQFALTVGDGTSASIACGVSSLHAWSTLEFFGNRDEASTNGSGCFRNGVLAATGTDLSARSGSFDGNQAFTLGSATSLAFKTDAVLAHIALYKQADWFSAGATGASQALVAHQDRFARLAGTYLRRAGGSALPTVQTRSTANTLRKCESGVEKLYLVGENHPRIEKFCDGTVQYLPESAMTPVSIQGGDFATSWTVVRSTVTTNTGADFFGGTTADTLREDGTAANTHRICQAFTSVSGTTYTFSVGAEAINRGHIRLVLFDGFAVSTGAFFDLASCAVGTVTNSTARGEVINGLCRAGVTATANASTTASACIDIAESDGDITFDGLSQDSIRLYGAQVEGGPTMTSYIPTTTVPVARGADSLDYAPTSMSLTQGSIVCRSVQPDHNTPTNPTATLLWVDGNNYVGLFESSLEYMVGATRSGGTFTSGIGTTDSSAGIAHTYALSYGPSGVKLFVDGVQEGTTASPYVAPVGSPTAWRIGYGIERLGGGIISCAYYPGEGRVY